MNIVFDYIDAEGDSKSKHAKIVDGILQAIAENKLKPGDALPSVNKIMAKAHVARMTAVKALNELKNRGAVEAKSRVGYFVKNEGTSRRLNVMLFLTSFDSYHEVLYHEIISGSDAGQIGVDLYFHHCNPDVFRAVIKEHAGLYDLYVVTPFCHPSVSRSLNAIPKHRLLQVARPPVLGGTAYVSQRFDEEVTNALLQIKERIGKYDSFKLIFPEKRGHPEEIKDAFVDFCSTGGISCTIEPGIEKDTVQNGTAFFVITDNDLIEIVKQTEAKGFRIGNEVGIVSYNETPMKEIIRNGITVVSTDFRQMGKEIRQFIETRKFIQKNIPTKVIVRNSL